MIHLKSFIALTLSLHIKHQSPSAISKLQSSVRESCRKLLPLSNCKKSRAQVLKTVYEPSLELIEFYSIALNNGVFMREIIQNFRKPLLHMYVIAQVLSPGQIPGRILEAAVV